MISEILKSSEYEEPDTLIPFQTIKYNRMTIGVGDDEEAYLKTSDVDETERKFLYAGKYVSRLSSLLYVFFFYFMKLTMYDLTVFKPVETKG